MFIFVVQGVIICTVQVHVVKKSDQLTSDIFLWNSSRYAISYQILTYLLRM